MYIQQQAMKSQQAVEDVEQLMKWGLAGQDPMS